MYVCMYIYIYIYIYVYIHIYVHEDEDYIMWFLLLLHDSWDYLCTIFMILIP